ncbi:carboxypeptidase-like regulatory domain-containing protein [Flavobacterium luminosum]|uniref:Carboxypeptidase-like regulatory domain-containing protein n=1 Tax=Flavobacterium luminosum TaxID=2949086 RepID=A0ABT0TLK5_9FLAO|nr:carboxypeptidase-like regulatory domain-containing protein [Flavobacterium sp. HXWNR70]MCL9808373.1 carboxypeptidase-like regulatory domain-containing protein [Flavobacterium sp. HXWNR70]
MKIVSKIVISVVFILILGCSKESFDEGGSGTIKGRVVRDGTFESLANVKISSNPNTSIVFTDSTGNFTMQNIPVGTYSFQAQKEGYVARFESGTILVNEVIEIVFELKPEEKVNEPPTTPVLKTPTDNSVDLPLNVTLTWSATDPESDPLQYTLTLRNDKDNSIVTISDLKESSYNLTNLKYSTKYYWQIAVSDGVNPSVLSAVGSFRTLDFPNARFLFTRRIEGNNVIFTANESGQELQITSSTSNCYRPKRNLQINRIAFIKSVGGQEHIFTMKPDGSDVLKITNSVPIAGFNMDHVTFSWSGNGSQIIYPYFDKLYRINADGSGLVQLYQADSGKFISECDWSNDNSLIALKTNDINGYNAEIIILDSAGNYSSTILTGVVGAVGGLHFSVNNQKLIYTMDNSGYQSPDYRQLDNCIYLYNFLTGLSTQLNVAKPAGTNDYDVRFSPNESELIFMNTSNDGISTRYIQKVSLTVNNSRTTLYTNGFMPDWK